MWQGGADSGLLRGKPVVEMMNAIGFDAMALGNHEFDWGLATLKERAGEGRFPLLAANIYEKATGQRPDFVKPYIILERAGVKIGIIGLITPDTPKTTNPQAVAGFVFADPKSTLASLVPEVRRQGADVVVALAHVESFIDAAGRVTGGAAALAAVPGVDAVVSGHSHQFVAGKAAGVPVVQAGFYGRATGRIILTYSKPDRKVLGSYVETVAVSAEGPAPDPAVQAIVEAAERAAAPIKSEVLGWAKAPLRHDKKEVSVLGQWVADAMREAAKADIAFENGGGIRASLPAGTLTMGMLYEILPFDNELWTVELTGRQVLAVLEHGLSGSRYGAIQFSGLRVKYDPSRPAGQRVLEVVTAGGEPLDPGQTYLVATNDFLMGGGDEYAMFGEGRNPRNLGIQLRDVLAEKVRKARIVDFGGDGRLALPAGAEQAPAKAAA